MEDMLSSLEVIQVVKIESDHVFIIISLLEDPFGLTILLLRFLSFGNHDENGWRRDFVNERVCRGEHSNLDVNACCFFYEATFMIELRSFGPLFHLLTDACNVDY